MDFSPTSRRNRRSANKSELYSTVVIHGDEEEEKNVQQDSRSERLRRREEEIEQDIYATMLCRDDDDDSSLPPLLKRLPKDFGAAVDYDDEEEDYGGSISGTVIVKTDRTRNLSYSSSSSVASARKHLSSPFLERSRASSRNRNEEDEKNFSTFVVRSTVRDRDVEGESVSGTFVRRTSGGGRLEGSTMSKAVASMQAAGELGLGKQRKGSGASSSLDEEGRRQQQASKMSSSSIPDSVTREDPATKYELLHELGKFTVYLVHFYGIPGLT